MKHKPKPRDPRPTRVWSVILATNQTATEDGSDVWEAFVRFEDGAANARAPSERKAAGLALKKLGEELAG